MYERVCCVCGNNFKSNKPSTKLCHSPHEKACKQCGSTFYVTINNWDKKFCCLSCAAEFRKQSGLGRKYASKAVQTKKENGSSSTYIAKEPRKCLICGKMFMPKSSNRKICYEKHYKNCCICGKPVEVSSATYKKDVTCSKECMLAKREKTMCERYGEKGSEARKFNDRKIQTNRKRFNADWCSQNPDIARKQKRTNVLKYGYECSSKSEKVKEKAKQTYLKKYGVDNPMKCDAIRSKLKQSVYSSYGCYSVLSVPDVQEKIKSTVQSRYGVPYFCMTDKCKSANGGIVSNVNKQFCQLLDANSINYSTEFKIKDRSYDVCINNTLVEINPTASHNSYMHVFTGTVKTNPHIDYHLNKTKLAEAHGYRCIHVWDWDDWNKIVQLVLQSSPVYARKCTIASISKKECNEFLSMHHLQGTCKGQIKRYALALDGKIVQVMTFGRPRYNRNFEWELLRLCSKPGIAVVGGAEKLFSHFVKENNPMSIVSYCDRSKFSGSVYGKLGFNLESEGSPSKHWYSPRKSERMQHITDNFLRQRGFDQIFGTDFGKGTSNEQLMIERGYLPVYDCGQMRFGWHKTS